MWRSQGFTPAAQSATLLSTTQSGRVNPLSLEYDLRVPATVGWNRREANTLGAKSNALGNTQAAIELKLLIEQMREQIQNIE